MTPRHGENFLSMVLLGNQVKDQDMADAIVHDLGNGPATFEASRWADFLGRVEGWEVQTADAIQAYIQAYIEGPASWVELSREGWPEDGSWNKFQRPSVRIVKGLYAVGFEPAGAKWPSVYAQGTQLTAGSLRE